MTNGYYGTAAFNDESDSESAKDWFLEPQAWLEPPGAPTLIRKGKILAGDRDRTRSRLRKAPYHQGYQRHVRPDGYMLQPLPIITDQSARKRQSLDSQASGQCLVPPPRNPARRLARQRSYKAVLTSLSPPSPSDKDERRFSLTHRRRSSNVDGQTVASLAANVIFTTNKVFSAMVHHANNGPNTGDISAYNPNSSKKSHRQTPVSSSHFSSYSISPAEQLSHRR